MQAGNLHENLPNRILGTLTVNAGNDTTILYPSSTVVLNGIAVSSLGNITSYTWRKVTGPLSYSISSNSTESTSVTGLVEGIYTFELAVTDDQSNSARDTVTIYVSSRVLFDFGSSLTSSPDSNGRYWNNVTTGREGIKVANAISTNNISTGIVLEIVNRIDGTFNVGGPGVNTGNTAGIVGDYPNSATTDYAFAHPSATNGTWRISGLDANKVYSIKFWGTKSVGWPCRIEIKTSTDVNWQSYNAANNTNFNTAAVFTISGSTQVDFNTRVVSPDPFGYISVVDINYISPCVPTSSSEDVTACNTYNWNGNDYTVSGTYTFTSTNAEGCDSVATINLTINNSSSSSADVTACNTYNWNGTDYTVSGTYTFTSTNAVGCDSVATLNLTININVNAGIDQVIEAGTSATLDGSLNNSSIGVGTWSGGNGTFSPDNATLNAVYTPSADEITAGSVTLTLTSLIEICGIVTDNMTILITNSTPVKLLSLSGNRDGSHNKLTWITANEINNHGFEIQRSKNGLDFSSIGFVNSLAFGGNSVNKLSYHFTDNNISGRMQYYRLRDIGNDNRSTFSNVIVVKEGNLLSLEVTGIYPNPASSILNVKIISPNQEQVILAIYDVTGKNVYNQNVSINAGSNLAQLSINRLASGTYTIRLLCNKDCDKAVGQFIKN